MSVEESLPADDVPLYRAVKELIENFRLETGQRFNTLTSELDTLKSATASARDELMNLKLLMDACPCVMLVANSVPPPPEPAVIRRTSTDHHPNGHDNEKS
jgi:hypothetical protein